MNPFAIIWAYRDAFLGGLIVTGQLVLLTATIGTALGMSLEALCGRLEGAFRGIIDATAFCVAAIPALVILFWLYYPGQILLGLNASPFDTALFALTIINTFAVYRIAGDAVRDLPQQFIATGLVCGLTGRDIYLNIKLPLLFRAAFPRWIDQQVVILQTSLFASLISVDETFRVAQRINAVVYDPVLIYTAMGILFLAIAGAAMYAAKYLRTVWEGICFAGGECEDTEHSVYLRIRAKWIRQKYSHSAARFCRAPRQWRSGFRAWGDEIQITRNTATLAAGHVRFSKTISVATSDSPRQYSTTSPIACCQGKNK